MQQHKKATYQLSALMMASALLLPVSRAQAWGERGHKYTSQLAVDDLPSELKPFYMANRDWIVQHSVDADSYWRRQSRAEAPHHFIDLDKWGTEAAANFPRDYDLACGLYGKEAVDKNGVVPWRIGNFYGRLVRAFKEQNARNIVEMSSFLSHYAADIHVPFHAAVNYDGQLSGQKGIHARFESIMVERQIKPEDLKTRPAHKIDDVVGTAFVWARDSLKLCDPILQADKTAVGKDAAYGDAYYTAFGANARPIAVRRLEEGAQDLASLWMSAWIAAGRPALPPVSDVHAGDPLDSPTQDPNLTDSGDAPANGEKTGAQTSPANPAIPGTPPA